MDHSDGALAPREFSRPVSADAVPSRELVEKVGATKAERAALARRFDLVALDRLVATVRLRRVRGGQMIRIAGRLEADVVQTCVVTLEPVRDEISEEFEALFAPPHLVEKVAEEMEIHLDDDAESPEPMEDGRIDISELVAQHLSLALDPYPRKAGVTFSHIEDMDDPDAPLASEKEPESTPERPNPFAALAQLKPKA